MSWRDLFPWRGRPAAKAVAATGDWQILQPGEYLVYPEDQPLTEARVREIMREEMEACQAPAEASTAEFSAILERVAGSLAESGQSTSEDPSSPQPQDARGKHA